MKINETPAWKKLQEAYSKDYVVDGSESGDCILVCLTKPGTSMCRDSVYVFPPNRVELLFGRTFEKKIIRQMKRAQKVADKLNARKKATEKALLGIKENKEFYWLNERTGEVVSGTESEEGIEIKCRGVLE